MFKSKISTFALLGATAMLSAPAMGAQVKVTFTNLAPSNGVYVTPVWVGFHNGSFDSYDGGTASAPALESIAEDGNVGPISAVFAEDTDGTTASGTLVDTGIAQSGASRVQGALGGGPIGPGGEFSLLFDVDLSSDNRYFSYVSMILPSSDYYIANGNPVAHDLAALTGGGAIEFLVGTPGTVNDAGTEINDFNTSAGNGFFPGLPTGQTGPNQGADQFGVNQNVSDPFANFLNTPAGFDTSSLNFNDASIYTQGGIGRIRIETIPEPSSMALMAGVVGLLGWRKRKAALSA